LIWKVKVQEENKHGGAGDDCMVQPCISHWGFHWWELCTNFITIL